MKPADKVSRASCRSFYTFYCRNTCVSRQKCADLFDGMIGFLSGCERCIARRRKSAYIWFFKEFHCDIRTVADANDVKLFVCDCRAYLFFPDAEIGEFLFDITYCTSDCANVWSLLCIFKSQHMIQRGNSYIEISYGSIPSLRIGK